MNKLTRLRYLRLAQFFLVYLLPAGLINLGNVFAYLFQLTIIRSLSIADVGAFNAIFSLTNVIAAPAAVLPFAVARAIIMTKTTEGAAAIIVARTAIAASAIAISLLAIGWILVDPLRAVLRIEHASTAMLTVLILCTTLLSGVGIGWLQGNLRHIPSALAIAATPGLRFLFGLWLVAWWAGGVDSAIMATAFPGALVFLVCLVTVRPLFRQGRRCPPDGTWRNFGGFVLTSSASNLLLLAFWNLDVVLVRAIFPPEASGLYAVASVLGRIPYLMSAAVANVLFSETMRSALDNPNDERASRRVLLHNLLLATVLGFAGAIPLSVFAEPILILFGGVAYAAATPILKVLSLAMAALALLQIVVTYLLARNRHQVLWLLGAGLLTFLSLVGLFANDPLDIVHLLAGTIVVLVIACGAVEFLHIPNRLPATGSGSNGKDT